MRLSIRYVTQFEYPRPVRESHNALRARPTTDDHQRLVGYRLNVSPAARVFAYRDYWGTVVEAFGVTQSHRRLVVVAESEVETSDRPRPDNTVDIDAYTAPEVRVEHWQYLQRSPHADWSDELVERARQAIGSTSGAVEAIQALHDEVNGALEYSPGTTYVGMDVNHVLAQGRGVCQDFAHLLIAACRCVGIPARYVSGYLYAADQATGEAPDRAEIEGQTHAWTETWVPGWGWWALDPTNPQPVGPRHVKIGHGRDYDDVTPLRGVYHGAEDHSLGVAVQMSREALTAMQEQVQQ